MHSLTAMIRGTLKVLVVLAVTLGLVLVIAADPSTVRLESARPVDTPTFVDYIAKVTAGPATSGDRYTVLVNGDQMFPAMLGAIRRAKDRVNFFTYVYEPGQAADQFGAAFAEAARRGVKVTIVVDAFGASNLPEDYARRLEDAGCVVEQFRPFRWYSLQETNYRNHRKILVVDGPTMMHAKTLVVDGLWSIVGSANFDNRSLDVNDELSVGVLDSDLAATLTANFETDLQRARRLSLDAWRRRPMYIKANERLWSLFSELF